MKNYKITNFILIAALIISILVLVGCREKPIAKEFSEGLKFACYSDYCVVVGLGSCTDTELVIPAE